MGKSTFSKTTLSWFPNRFNPNPADQHRTPRKILEKSIFKGKERLKEKWEKSN